MSEYVLRPAWRDDYQQLTHLINQREYVHRHLDWRSPIDWLGTQPFWVMERKGKIVAALAFPADPPGVAWIRFFCTSSGLKISEVWKLLFTKALDTFSETSCPVIASVATQGWYVNLLKKNGFIHHQDIVVLQWEHYKPPPLEVVAGVEIHPMQPYDASAVAEVDQKSFEAIWQHSEDGIKAAYYQAEYSTIAMLEGQVIGYQISTATPFNAHLARLAVVPSAQKRGIGRLLVSDMIRHFYKRGLNQITVNTQHDNKASLSVYKKTGFILTGDRFPVYCYHPDQEKGVSKKST